MTTTTCADRIDKELASRVEDFNSFLTRQRRASLVENWEKLEDNEREWDEYPLAVERLVTYRIELSYGGPQDYLSITVDADNDPRQITYHFLDWFDGASVPVTGEAFNVVAAWAQKFIEVYE